VSRDWRLYTDDILNSITKIEKYTRGLEFQEFAADQLRVDAVLRNLALIGEAATRTPAEVQQRLPGVQWSRIREVASGIIPAYEDVRLPVIWETIQDLPLIVPPLRAALAEEDDS
jgi:uncharacterized protein with HEPN domain